MKLCSFVNDAIMHLFKDGNALLVIFCSLIIVVAALFVSARGEIKKVESENIATASSGSHSSVAASNRNVNRQQWLQDLQVKKNHLSTLLDQYDDPRNYCLHWENPMVTNARLCLVKLHFIITLCRMPLSGIFFLYVAYGFQVASTDVDCSISNLSWLLQLFNPRSGCRTQSQEGDNSESLPYGYNVASDGDRSTGCLSWLVRLLKPRSGYGSLFQSQEGGDAVNLPPIARQNPAWFFVWSKISRMLAVSCEDKFHEAETLISFVRSNIKHGRLSKNDVIAPLRHIFRFSCNEIDVRACGYALALLCFDTETMKAVTRYCSIGYGGTDFSFLARTLNVEKVPLQVQSTLASAISQLLSNYPSYRETFRKNGAVSSLIHCLTFTQLERQDKKNGGELSSLDTEAHMKAMATRALWMLAKGNPSITKGIIKSKLITWCFCKLLTNESPKDCTVSVKLLMEIANSFGEENEYLRHFFQEIYLADANGICEQLRRIVYVGGQNDYADIVPCLVSFSCLHRTFENTKDMSSYNIYIHEGWKPIGYLIYLLEGRDPGIVSEEVAITLFKHIPLRSLIFLIYHKSNSRVPALVLLCFIAMHAPFAENFDMGDVHSLLEWASEERSLILDATIDRLMFQAKFNLDQLYALLTTTTKKIQ